MKVHTGALLLCLLSVCRAAPLTCDQLLTTQDHDRDLSGRWYLHAASFDSCAESTVSYFLKASQVLDLSLTETPKQYVVLFRLKWFSKCWNLTERYSVTPSQQSERSLQTISLLPSSCSDCIVFSFSNGTYLSLLSRSSSIDAADLKQFETQAACAGSANTQPFDNHYDFDNCDYSGIHGINDLTADQLAYVAKRFADSVPELTQCYAKDATVKPNRWVKDLNNLVTALAETLLHSLPEPVRNGWNWIRSFIGQESS